MFFRHFRSKYNFIWLSQIGIFYVTNVRMCLQFEMGDVPSKEQNRGGGDHSVSQAEIQRLRQQVAQLQRQQQQQQQQVTDL
jgi:hypothetical protein